MEIVNSLKQVSAIPLACWEPDRTSSGRVCEASLAHAWELSCAHETIPSPLLPLPLLPVHRAKRFGDHCSKISVLFRILENRSDEQLGILTDMVFLNSSMKNCTCHNPPFLYVLEKFNFICFTTAHL